MDIEQLRNLCLSLDGVIEDIKWEHDLCFCIMEKIFCVTNLNDTEFRVTLKVNADEFEKLLDRPGIFPAPYLARHKWIRIEGSKVFTQAEWKHYISQSYDLIKDNLPKRTKTKK